MTSPSLQGVRLYRMDLSDHPCPWGLKAIQLLQDFRIPFEDRPLRSQAEVDAFKAAYAVATTPELFAGEERIGGYTDLAARLGVRPESAEITDTPVIAVFATAALMALVLGHGVAGFMGIAICLLAMLKLMDVPAFASTTCSASAGTAGPASIPALSYWWVSVSCCARNWPLPTRWSAASRCCWVRWG